MELKRKRESENLYGKRYKRYDQNLEDEDDLELIEEEFVNFVINFPYFQDMEKYISNKSYYNDEVEFQLLSKTFIITFLKRKNNPSIVFNSCENSKNFEISNLGNIFYITFYQNSSDIEININMEKIYTSIKIRNEKIYELKINLRDGNDITIKREDLSSDNIDLIFDIFKAFRKLIIYEEVPEDFYEKYS